MRRSIRLLAGLLLAAAATSCDPGTPAEEIAFGSYPITAAVEQWRKLVEKHFKYQHVTWALNIIQCESGGDPNAYNSSSGASGLFQHLKQYWAARAASAGFAGASPFNAEANIAASAYLLYASGGGPQHWSCKFSPFEDFNYKPQFYKNGSPVGCTPSCSGSKITGADCGVGDCATFGATCVNDSLGVRCVSVFCPPLGQKKVCASDKLIGDCNNGGISTGDCSVYGAFCSTAGNTAARCVSVFCAAGPSEATKAHSICLPDGRLAQCTNLGAVTDATACAAGETCLAANGGASCVKPSAPAPDSGSPARAPEAGVSPATDLGLGPDPATDGGGSHPDAELPSLAAGSHELQGACQIGMGAPAGPPPLLLLLLALALVRRSRPRW